MLLAGCAALRSRSLRSLSTVAAPQGLQPERVLEKRRTPLSKQPSAAAAGASHVARSSNNGDALRNKDTSALVARIREYGAAHKWQEVLHLVKQAGPRPRREEGILYNTAIAAVGRSGQFTPAMQLLDTMRARRLLLSEVTYGSALLACAYSGQPDEAVKLLAEMAAAGVPRPSAHYTSVVQAFLKAGLVQQGLAQLQQWIAGKQIMPTAHVYNRMVKALLEQGADTEAFELFESARARGIVLDVITYTYAALALGKSENTGAAAAQLIRDMEQAGIPPNLQMYTAVW
jgi:pentatricopeptide repeat protein